MKTDCIEFNDCRLPVSMCNGKCKLYQPVRKKTYKGSKKWTTGEKKKPVRQGGSDTAENLEAICFECHAKKH